VLFRLVSTPAKDRRPSLASLLPLSSAVPGLGLGLGRGGGEQLVLGQHGLDGVRGVAQVDLVLVLDGLDRATVFDERLS
jgi:hypothetical protein